MIVNGKSLIQAAPIKNMVAEKIRENGVTYGLGEAGYDIRIKQGIHFLPDMNKVRSQDAGKIPSERSGRFVIASAMEEFQMPDNLIGVVHDKSSWARHGLSVFNTVIESGWCGFLTLELVYHGDERLIIPAGAGIAQVLFHSTTDTATYSGRYQNQPDRPVEAIHSDQT